ncbi:hypothetical protein Tco_1388361, partial [Tanacetum coccineum]
IARIVKALVQYNAGSAFPICQNVSPLSMKDPSFFMTNKTRAPQGEELGLVNPLSEISYNWVDNSCISDRASLYVDRATGATPGTKSIRNLTFRAGGSPGKSSRKTYGKSRTIDDVQSRITSTVASITLNR